MTLSGWLYVRSLTPRLYSEYFADDPFLADIDIMYEPDVEPKRMPVQT